MASCFPRDLRKGSCRTDHVKETSYAKEPSLHFLRQINTPPSPELRSVSIKLIWAVLQAAAIDILLVNFRECQK